MMASMLLVSYRMNMRREAMREKMKARPFVVLEAEDYKYIKAAIERAQDRLQTYLGALGDLDNDLEAAEEELSDCLEVLP